MFCEGLQVLQWNMMPEKRPSCCVVCVLDDCTCEIFGERNKIFRTQSFHSFQVLLICSTVLTWDGEVSAVSQDAVRDTVCFQSQTVLEDWDEEFDSGKVSLCELP